MTLHAVILAGGYGSRMMPLTAHTPKHLLPIGDEPVIAHQWHRLRRAGVLTVTLATAYQAEAFVPLLGYGQAYGLELRYTREDSPLGTGGALRHACGALQLRPGDAIVVLNGDLLSEHDLGAHVEAHLGVDPARRPLATIHARPVLDASAYGLLHVDGSRVTRFEEKPADAPAGLVNAGTYVISPELLDLVGTGSESDGVISLEREVFPAAVETRRGVATFVDDAAFRDIGTPEALLEANRDWAARHPRAREVLTHAEGPPSIVLDALVAPDARVAASLVLPGARIDDGASVRSSVLGPGSRVGAGASLEGCVLGHGAQVPAGARLMGVPLDAGTTWASAES